MNRKTINGEIARKCGSDNAYFGYRIDTATSAVEYFVNSFIGGKSEALTFARYADARAYFDSL